MKRLIQNSKKNLNFKNWVVQHDPKLKWDFDNPDHLKEQLCNVVAESGDIDLKTIFNVMFSKYDSGLITEQNSKFILKKY